jgi:hypothetical protein
MMAQIRDCGDGIRDGTYTMTAPKITGGTITGVTLTGNTFSNPVITGVSTFAAGTVSAPAITTSGDTNTGIFFPAADTIAFTEGGVESMRIDSSGNVGIGTSPATPLHVYKSSGTSSVRIASGSGTGEVASVQFYGTDSASAAQIYSQIVTAVTSNTAGAEAGYLGFETTNAGATTEKMRITSGGNVGIGQTSPSCRLDVNRGSAGLLANFTDGVNTNFQIETSSLVVFVGPSAGSTSMAFITGNIERMRIDSSGNLFLGKTSDNSNNQGLSFFPSGAVQSANNGSGTVIHYEFYRSGSRVGRIETTASATSYVTSSDYRLKENISPMTGALSKVAQLKPCTYTWKSTGYAGQGFIAHELAEVIPDAVSGNKDAINEDGSIDPQGIDTSFLVATLTAAIQELNAKVEAQAAEIALLKSK